MKNISIFTSAEMLFIDEAGFVISFSNGGQREHLEPLNNEKFGNFK